MGDSRIHIGTSGWTYDHWKEVFYPQEKPQKEWLDYYARHFSTVEINNSFYNLPKRETFESWRNATPEGFLFSLKASRYITHMKKLREPGESLARFLDRGSVLGEKLGPVLFQLPPRWRVNPERLGSFLDMLPETRSYTFEFRDSSWFHDEVYDLLSGHNAAFCIYELGDVASPRQITADFVYIRLHGPGGPYQGRYGTAALSGWAGALSAWRAKGLDVYCYFDNDDSGYAVMNARELGDMLS